MDIQVGDILTMKKQHPCGEKRWEVLRIGADFKLRCLGCGREVMARARSSRKWSGRSTGKRDKKPEDMSSGFSLSVEALEKQCHGAGPDVRASDGLIAHG